MKPLIHAENIGKKYLIRHEHQERYIALRDVIARKAGKLFSFPKSLRSRQVRVGFEEFWALKNLNFDIQAGDRVGIIGRNGAGKSTLLKILSRITEPSTGRIELNGRVASLLEVGTGFHPELSGRENIFLNGAILGMSRIEIRQKFDEIVDFSGVEKFLDTPVKRYSSGMYVRLAFAVAAHLETEILIVDEVLAVGDAEFQKRCLWKMGEVSEQKGRTVLFVSHNMGALNTLCERGIFLNSGQMVLSASIDQVISAYSKSIYDNISQEYRHHKGGDQLCITKISINPAFAAKTQIFDALSVTIEVSILADVGPFHGFLVLHDKEGAPIVSYFQKDSDEYFNARQGMDTIHFSTKNGLLPGTYFLSAGFFDMHGAFLDWVEMGESFEVLPNFSNGKPFDQRLGIITNQGVWKH